MRLQSRASIRVADLNGDGKMNADDRTIIGRHYNFPQVAGEPEQPRHVQEPRCSVLATARIGFTINDAFTAAYNSLAGRFNNIKANYWTPENQTGTDPRPSIDGLGNFASARNYKDGSFVRIRDITLGYTLRPAPGESVRRRRVRDCTSARRTRSSSRTTRAGIRKRASARQRRQRRVADRPGRSGFPVVARSASTSASDPPP